MVSKFSADRGVPRAVSPADRADAIGSPAVPSSSHTPSNRTGRSSSGTLTGAGSERRDATSASAAAGKVSPSRTPSARGSSPGPILTPVARALSAPQLGARATSGLGRRSTHIGPPPSLPEGLGAAKAEPQAAAYPTQARLLLSRHARGGLAASTVLAAARQILAQDPRFAAGGKHGLLAPLWRIPSQPKHLRALAAMPPKQRQKLIKHLTDDLVGLVHRPAVQLRPLGTGGPLFGQRASHLEEVKVGQQSVYRQTFGVTLSSQAAARDRASHNTHLRQHLANAHEITAGPELIAFRSARSDTAAKMRQKLTGAALAALQAAGGDPAKATGWHLEAGAWHFAPTLITAMDRSLIKHVYLSFMRLFGGQPSERSRLAELQASASEVFASGARLSVLVQADGQTPMRVHIGPPKLLNIVVSEQSMVAGNIRASRRDNQPMMLRLWGETVARWEASPDAARRALAARLGRPESPAAARAALTALAAPNGVHLAELDSRARLAVEALSLTFLGATSGGHTLQGRTDPGDETLLLQALLQEAGNAALIECKSGLDRTLTLAALMAASAAQAAAGTPFDPLDAGADRKGMQALFTQFADAFGSGPVKMTRSMEGHVKWRSQPTPRAWYAQDAQASGPLGDFTR